ncbi:MAG: hypothetical protein GW788_10115 [Ignavibacteria bacterium]|nr:hypothetical protein [Ignavibacteria bacterium]
MKNKFVYVCSLCGTQYEITKDLMLWPACREDKLHGVGGIVYPSDC